MTSREPGATEDGVTPVLGAALPRRAEPIAALRRGDSVGRYVILDWVGQGGMGVVYAGYDPELDRKVAIKLVRPELHSAESPAGLLREARAMARVRHPGVIAIHDIGVVDEQVFLAMEFIDGGTLAAWLRAAPRSWSAVLAMFVQAGRGLVQAHRVGVLHRDFKPKSECPPQTPPLPPSGRILADRGDLRGAVCRVMPHHAAVLATEWQRLARRRALR